MIRQRINLPLTIPSDAAHLIIPEQYKISLRNEIDSTFMSVPITLYQLFVIHGEKKHVLITCVFALMEPKTEIMYGRVWRKVRENCEITCQTAMFAAIAFIEEDNVIRAYEALEEHLCLNSFEQQFRELLNYYEDTFIGRRHLTGRPQPLFPIRLWNQSERTENGTSGTNNKVNDWHNAFARLVRVNHQNIFKFLASLQRKLCLVYVKIEHIHMRTTQQNTMPVYNQINWQLIELMERRHTIPILTLLDQISYLLTH
ncbi:hypothetical protein HZS_2475 [Henneguya salminicola]|nr:hypothetical protein HZS_2475 [Henneguya salminicola]